MHTVTVITHIHSTHTHTMFTNKPPLLLAGNGFVYSRTRRNNKSGFWKHRWHP